MLSVVCPACATNLQISDDLKGKRVNCGGCGNAFSIASHAEQVVVPTQVVSAESQLSDAEQPQSPDRPLIQTGYKSFQRRVRGTSAFQKVLFSLLHLCIPLATVYGGYQMYLLTQRRSQQQSPPVAKVDPPRQQKTPKRLPKAPTPLAPKEFLPRSPDTPREESKPKKPQDYPSHPAFPRQVRLPESYNRSIVTLVEDLSELTFKLLCTDPRLTHVDSRILWQKEREDEPVLVGGMKLEEKDLVFRWGTEIPEEAESAVRNSVIKITQGKFEQTIALRQPQVTKPIEMSLRNNVQNVVAEIKSCPPMQELFFELTGANKLPHHRTEGRDKRGIQIKDVITLWYNETEKAATRLTMKKRDKAVVVNFDSRYKLPSGEEGPMSLPKLERKQKIIKRELAAQNSMAWQNELKELERVYSVARALDGTKDITCRFYMVVAGHEVDLLIAK